jgi:hypothetical protein
MNPKNLGPTHSDDEDADGDLIAILDILIESRWTIIAIVCAFLLLGTAYAFLAKPVYEANIMVQVEDSPDTSAAKSLLGDVSALFDVKSSAAAEAQILASRLVVSRSVDNLNLFIYAKPRRFPLIGQLIARHHDGLSEPGLAGFGGFAWGHERIEVPVFNVPLKIEGDGFLLTFWRTVLKGRSASSNVSTPTAVRSNYAWRLLPQNRERLSGSYAIPVCKRSRTCRTISMSRKRSSNPTSWSPVCKTPTHNGSPMR